MDVRGKTSNEKRLIDANAFLKDILTAGIGKTIIEYSESDIGYMIRKRPIVDAVEVVRCRECVHYEMGVCLKIYDDGAASIYAWQERKPDDFCSYGERKGCTD